MSLLETTIYAVLLSLLITGLVRFSYDNYFQDVQTAAELQNAYENFQANAK